MEEGDKSVDKYERERLEWIDTCDKLDDLAEITETRRARMIAKIKANPVVPVGMLATTIALSVGLWAMKRGDKRTSQYMMRARIGAQAFTITALLVGIYLAEAKRKKPADDT